MDLGEVEFGGKDCFLLPGWTGKDLAVRSDDDGVAGLDPLAVVLPLAPHALTVGEVGGDLVDVNARVHTDDVQRPSRAMWRMVAIQPSPTANVGASQTSTPWE